MLGTRLVFASALRAFLGSILCVISVAVMPAPAFGDDTAGETVSPQRAVSVMKALEGKFTALRWKSHYECARLNDGDDPDSIVERLWPNVDVDVVFDRIARRYRCRAEGTYKWVDGPAPNGSSVEEHAFDGELHQFWSRRIPGTVLPTAQSVRANGRISRDRADIADRDYLESSCLMLGWAYLPPYFWHPNRPPQPLSSLLQTWIDEGRNISIVEDENDTWSIVVPWKEVTELGTLHLSYDVGKGGVVRRARWVNKWGHDTARLDVELEQTDMGIWMPRSIRRIRCLDKFLDRIDYKDIEINPTIDAETFRCEFPEGCKVEDLAEKRTYLVGATTEEAALADAPAECEKEEPAAEEEIKPTHQEIGTILVETEAEAGSLRTFCLNADGNLLVACGGDRVAYVQDENGRMEVKRLVDPAEIRLIDPDGKQIATWSPEVTPQAINVAEDGAVFVGGEGRLAKLDKSGKVLTTADAPNVAELGPMPEAPGDESEEEKKASEEEQKAKQAKIVALSERLNAVRDTLQEAAREKAAAKDDEE
ncbi:MAG: hypothetical protein ABIP48_12600, partial [Planctomycetota bacterium]